MSEQDHAQDVPVGKDEEEVYPPHPPRANTPEYQRTHHDLIYVQKRGCFLCGVNVDTLTDDGTNPWHAKQLETHHFPLQREFVDFFDPSKVINLLERSFGIHDHGIVLEDRTTLVAFVDSE